MVEEEQAIAVAAQERAEKAETELTPARQWLDAQLIGDPEQPILQRIQHLEQDHQDYIATIKLNVPEPYRLPQLDLCMVRMRDRIAQLESELTALRAEFAQRIERANDEIQSTQERAARAEAERDRLIRALEMIYDKWENGDPCYGDAETLSDPIGNAVELSYEEENEILALIPRTPSAALAASEPEKEPHA